MLDIKIKEIKYINTEQERNATLDSKSVRFDVYVEDGKRIFDVEMQMADTKELPKRTRYYQSIIDIDNLDSGDHYKDMKESFIIFIMKKDIFCAGLPRYTFENVCRENPSIKLNDKTEKIFYNISAYSNAENENVRNILEYFKTGKHTDGLTERMQLLLDKARKNAKWRNAYMTMAAQRNFWEIEAREKGEREGRRKGLKEGRMEGLVKGAHDKATETAKNLLAMELSSEQISKATGLPLDEIIALQAEVTA